MGEAVTFVSNPRELGWNKDYQWFQTLRAIISRHFLAMSALDNVFTLFQTLSQVN
jgi:hypothetical protein